MKDQEAICLATLAAERRFRLSPTRQLRRLRRFATERNYRVVGTYLHGLTLHLASKRDGLTLAIDKATERDAVIVVLDGKGKPRVLRLEGEKTCEE